MVSLSWTWPVSIWMHKIIFTHSVQNQLMLGPRWHYGKTCDVQTIDNMGLDNQQYILIQHSQRSSLDLLDVYNDRYNPILAMNRQLKIIIHFESFVSICCNSKSWLFFLSWVSFILQCFICLKICHHHTHTLMDISGKVWVVMTKQIANCN